MGRSEGTRQNAQIKLAARQQVQKPTRVKPKAHVPQLTSLGKEVFEDTRIRNERQ